MSYSSSRKKSLVDYSKISDRPVQDNRFMKAAGVSNPASVPAVVGAAQTPAQMEAVMRLMTGREERTIAEKFADSSRPTWEQYKKVNHDKLNLDTIDEIEMEKYRKGLDAEREKRLNGGVSLTFNKQNSDDSEEDRHTRKSKDRKSKRKHKKHKRRKRSKYSSSDDDDDESSEFSDHDRKKRKRKHSSEKKTSKRHLKSKRKYLENDDDESEKGLEGDRDDAIKKDAKHHKKDRRGTNSSSSDSDRGVSDHVRKNHREKHSTVTNNEENNTNKGDKDR